MRKRDIICAFYIPDSKKFDKYNKFMKVIVENKRKLKPIYFEEDDGQIVIVFYEDRLKKIEKYLSGNALEMYKKIDGKYRHCSVCGCAYLSYIPYQYRKNNGIVGRSYECEICGSISDSTINYVKKYAKKHGSKKTITGLLKGTVFKHYKADPELFDDDLPF
ncbi:MAG: hypothetical protein K5768_06925 [Firmicutes bacterium]|nr:hypothetical protein [Bacillota bacterium]